MTKLNKQYSKTLIKNKENSISLPPITSRKIHEYNDSLDNLNIFKKLQYNHNTDSYYADNFEMSTRSISEFKSPFAKNRKFAIAKFDSGDNDN